LVVLAAAAMAATVVAWGLPASVAGTICDHHVCPEPDLVVTAAGVSFARPYVFQGHHVRGSFADITKNAGKGSADHQSETGLVLAPIHAPPHEPSPGGVELRDVPKLLPEKSNSDVTSVRFPADVPLGAYKVYVCADFNHKIKESNEHNNCKWSGEYFYVIRKQWSGSVSGDAGCCSAAKLEKWHTVGTSADPTSGGDLDFKKYLGDGNFRYHFSGTVEYTDHGAGMYCSYDGGGPHEKHFNNEPDVELNYLRGKYGGVVRTGGTFYKITLSGGFPSNPCTGTFPGPVSRDVLKTRPGAENVDSLNYDQTTLKGSFGSSAPEAPQWRWDFQLP
jgi:hypothetical protein